jgi:hypothetical protein
MYAVLIGAISVSTDCVHSWQNTSLFPDVPNRLITRSMPDISEKDPVILISVAVCLDFPHTVYLPAVSQLLFVHCYTLLQYKQLRALWLTSNIFFLGLDLRVRRPRKPAFHNASVFRVEVVVLLFEPF